MDPITIGLTVVLARGIQSILSSAGQSKSTTSTDIEQPPSDVITFIGATGVGKSSTINALANNNLLKIGAAHGTTVTIEEVNYKAGYRLRDTPGLMDTTDFSSIVWSNLKSSKLIIYVSTGQLYGPEIKTIERIYRSQMNWNRESSLNKRRELALYINKLDTKKCMDSLSHTREIAAIKNQVQGWIPENRIVFGSASPVENNVRQPSQISQLRLLIDDCCNIQL